MSARAQATRLAVPKPLYSQVRDALMDRIRDGEWSAGQTLPNEYMLAGDFGVSVGTIRRAIEGLEDGGVVKRIQGRGTFVSGPGTLALHEKFFRLRGDTGRPPLVSFTLRRKRQRPAIEDETQLLLGAVAGDVLEVEQVVTVDGREVGHERSIISAARVPDLLAQLTHGQSLYDLLASFGVLVTRVQDRVFATRSEAAPELCRLLRSAPGTPYLCIERTAFAIDMQPVERRVSFFDFAGAGRLAYDAGAC